MNTLAANDTQAQMQQSLEEAQSAVTAGLSALDAKASEREAYARGRIAHNEADLTLLQSRLSGRPGALAKADLRQGLVSLRAQADAIVLSVARVSVGSVLQSGAELITLVPNDAHLEVEAAVSGRDVGWVRPGQAVTVKFDTLPFSRYGTGAGNRPGDQSCKLHRALGPCRGRIAPSHTTGSGCPSTGQPCTTCRRGFGWYRACRWQRMSLWADARCWTIC